MILGTNPNLADLSSVRELDASLIVEREDVRLCGDTELLNGTGEECLYRLLGVRCNRLFNAVISDKDFVAVLAFLLVPAAFLVLLVLLLAFSGKHVSHGAVLHQNWSCGEGLRRDRFLSLPVIYYREL